MKKLLKLCENLRSLWWLGLWGVLGTIFNVPWLMYFNFFFLFGLLGFPLALKGESGVIWQPFAQIFGMIFTPLRHGFRLPDKNSHASPNSYILPFSGSWTVVNGGADKEISHSWGIYPQRYALDFIMTDDDGNYFQGDKTALDSYFCYGADIIAPADGVIVKSVAHHPDSRVDGEKAHCDANDILGNHLIIDHGGGEFSLIGHLAPNSLTATAGEWVQQGQIIAKCGNSGNTSMPHIHFQLQAGKGAFLSAGLPIAFSGIAAQPHPNYAKIDPRPTNGNLQTINNKTYIGRGVIAINEACKDSTA
ncbi:MAG: M23 family metallopeptidase [Defluviitaleaceae bacterium]|nr:M23 family metallopeptidase [Defluviitaleaceae bacterium]